MKLVATVMHVPRSAFVQIGNKGNGVSDGIYVL